MVLYFQVDTSVVIFLHSERGKSRFAERNHYTGASQAIVLHAHAPGRVWPAFHEPLHSPWPVTHPEPRPPSSLIGSRHEEFRAAEK